MGLHSKSGEIDWDEARRQGDVPGRAGAMRLESLGALVITREVPDLESAVGAVLDGRLEVRGPSVQMSLLDTTPPPVKRGLDPRNPDSEAWDEAYYGVHSDGGD